MDKTKTNDFNFSLTDYKAVKGTLIRQSSKPHWISERSFGGKRFTPRDVDRILNNGSIEEKIRLSEYFFEQEDLYKQAVLHYATLLQYVGILIPLVTKGQKLSDKNISKKYDQALGLVDKMNLASFLTECATAVFVRGTYYGVIANVDKNNFSVIDLPFEYCRSRYKDMAGNNIVEFNVKYFNTLSNSTIDGDNERESALSAYPDFIVQAYRRGEQWVTIPSEDGICFRFLDGSPFIVGMIPEIMKYKEALALGLRREAAEIKKIIVQKIPHLADGRFLLEPIEAAEVHSGAVEMLKDNPEVDVMTTYADVQDISTNVSAQSANTLASTMLNNAYAHGGISGQLFDASGSSTMIFSLENDLAIVMYLGNKFNQKITQIINDVCGNPQVKFKYQILPVTYYNVSDYITQSFKLAEYGYSALLPAIASGLSQKDFVAVKELENDFYNLILDKMHPLQSANVQSGTGEVGRPALKEEQKSERTLANEKSKSTGTSTQ